MKIEIRLYASLARFLPEQSTGDACIIDLPEGKTVKELLSQLGVPLESVKLIFINHIHAGDNRVLKDGDRLGIFPPVAGG